MIIQLILIDDKTKQPQKVETILEGTLDITSALQKQIYLNTINSLSTTATYVTDVIIQEPQELAEPDITIDLFDPEETIENSAD